MAERILTERELNRALLVRQLLLERGRTSIAKAVERVGGLQTQYAPSGYVGLWSRLEGLTRDAFTRALERKRIVQATMMRVTIHVVSAADYWPLTEAIRDDRREQWRAAARRLGSFARIERAAALVRELLADGPRSRSEITGEFGLDSVTWNGVGLEVDLVRVPPSGTWEQRRADRYALAESWLGPSAATKSAGLELLIRRYLGGFGPASPKDLASWSGLPASTLAPALEGMALRTLRDEAGGELIDLPRAPLPAGGTPAPVRFLPTWDATLLVHARRTQVLPESYRPRVFDTKTPHSVPTFLVDGRVAGTWREERGRITVHPFGRLPQAVRGVVEDEAERLAAFHA